MSSRSPVGKLPVPLTLGVINATATASVVRSLVATRGRNTSTAPATAKTGARISVSAPPQRPAARHRGDEDVP
ncbi:hypothetical protein [Streptomyces sp. yara]|uniref:hypothetical protein n=1 Tax=Streptomyces sp. yara TaxID=3458421 RepID=UPI00403FEA96